MPRIMTMNGDHQSVAAAPLDLRTTNRERGSAAGSRTQDCKCRVRDARVSGGSPAPPACNGTDSLDRRRSAGSETGVSRKRPADKSSLRLPFRKRPIPVEPETQRQSPAPPESADRFSPAGEADLTLPDSFANRAAQVTPRRDEEARQSPETYPIRFVRPFEYGHYAVYCVPSVPEHTVVHQTENLLTGITLATRQDEDGDTALHIAVAQGELAIFYQLIHLLRLAHRSLDIYNNLRQNSGKQELEGRNTAIDKLEEFHKDALPLLDYFFYNPLHLAVITQQANMVEALLGEGADPAALDRNGQTAIHLCCEYNQHDCLAVVLSHSSSATCLEIRNYEGLSPLHLAVLRGHKDLGRMLLNAGADINAMDVKSGQSPLMHAVESNNADMVHFLIESGCDVNSQSYSGNTALHSACGRGQVDTVRLLLKSGADSSLKNYHNDTPVMVAKNKKIADVLRGRGSNQIRVQDQHCVSVSPHGSTLTENGSPSPNHSRGCSPSTTPLTLHHSNSHSPKTPSTLVFPYY